MLKPRLEYQTLKYLCTIWSIKSKFFSGSQRLKKATAFIHARSSRHAMRHTPSRPIKSQVLPTF